MIWTWPTLHTSLEVRSCEYVFPVEKAHIPDLTMLFLFDFTVLGLIVIPQTTRQPEGFLFIS